MKELEKVKAYYTRQEKIERAVAIKKEIENLQALLKTGSPSAGPGTETEPGPGTKTGDSKPMRLKDVFKALPWEKRGFTLGETSIGGQFGKSDKPIMSSQAVDFSGKCAYSLRVKVKWYEGAELLIDEKRYSISVGHWWNGGTMLVYAGKVLRLKGAQYKRDPKEWNEVAITIDGQDVSYFYNGKLVHKVKCDVPKQGKLKWGTFAYSTKN